MSNKAKLPARAPKVYLQHPFPFCLVYTEFMEYFLSVIEIFYPPVIICLTIVYIILVVQPDFLAKWLLSFVSFFLPGSKFPAISFWNLLDQLKFRRRLIIFFLSIFLSLFIIFDFYLFIYTFPILTTEEDAFFNLLIVFALLVYAVITGTEFFKIGKVEMVEIAHPKERKLQSMLENLSIATGIEKPDLKIVASTNPTAFSIAKFFEYPSIYVTTQLLHISNDNELEGVLGHEIAHILSNRTQDFTLISLLILGLKVSSYFLFLFLLLLISPSLALGWMGYNAAFSFRAFEKISFEDEQYVKLFHLIFTALNPPYILLNFFLVTIFYLFTGDEDFFADVTSVQLNRYTGGIFSVLQKIRSYDEPKQTLPEALSPLYFTKEAAPSGGVTWQPEIETRLEILASIDSFAAVTEVKTKTDLKCPYCKETMEELMVPTTYKYNVKVERCPYCSSVWFDQSELWIVADLVSLSQKPKILVSPPDSTYLCPKCGVGMHLKVHANIPSYYKVYECPVCKGNFMHQGDLVGFGAYRRSTSS